MSFKEYSYKIRSCDAKDYASELYGIIKQEQDYWTYLYVHEYGSQHSNAKTYQWLAVTFITAYIAIFVNIDSYISESFKSLILALFIIGISCSTIVLALATLIMSSLFWPKIKQHPLGQDYPVDMANRLLYYGPSSHPHLKTLYNIVISYENAIKSLWRSLHYKGLALIAQCCMTLLSLACGIAIFWIFIIDYFEVIK